MSHHEKCRVHVIARAKHLARSKVRESCVEGLLTSFVQQPAYYASERASLIKLGLDTFNAERNPPPVPEPVVPPPLPPISNPDDIDERGVR